MISKIVDVESDINKKKLEEHFQEQRKFYQNLKRKHTFEFDKIMEQKKKVFAHVESKTSSFFPHISTTHKRSTSFFQTFDTDKNGFTQRY